MKENKSKKFKEKASKLKKSGARMKTKQELENEDAKEDIGNNKTKGHLKNHSPYGNPNWYFTDAGLAEQASRFSFQSFIGNGSLIDTAKLPSIAILALHPSVGGYVGVTQDYDPVEDNASVQSVNLMARKLYSRLSANSGRTPSYQPQDVIMSILGVGEVLSIVSHLRRVIGTAFTYSKRNRDFPNHMLRALGVNPDDLLSNLSKYRVEFNTVLNMANKIPILANITWFSKCMSIYEGIFADSPDEMAQMYAFVPGSTWIIDESSYSDGTILKTVPFCMDLQNSTHVVKTFGDYLTILKAMINSLLTSTTYNLIYADIINMARKQDVPLMQIELVREDYTVVPVYDEEVLLHIHNMNIFSLSNPDYFTNTLADLSGRSISNCNDVFQDPETNNVIYAPLFKISGSSNLTDIGVTTDPAAKIVSNAALVDFPYGDPDLTERLEATRFAVRLNPNEIVEGETGEDLFAYAKTLPDHFCSTMFMFTDGLTGSNIASRLVSTLVYASGTNRVAFMNLEKFRYAPLVYVYAAGANYEGIAGDVNYFTELDGTWLKRLNALCLQGLFELR